jgi:signal transduction histidine kinase
MSVVSTGLNDTGLEVIDLLSDPQFAARKLHDRNVSLQTAGLQRLCHAFVEKADSAGISIEREDGTEKEFYHWIATAGVYSDFLNAILPRYPSACGVCLELGRPQLFRVSKRFFEILGVVAPVVTDGLLLPWQVEGSRGTIFIMAHERDQAFDADDLRMMQMLADFAAMGFRHQRQQEKLIEQERAAAAAAMANQLAHQINNPLQSLTNVVYLAAHGESCADAKALANSLAGDVERLSGLVNQLLVLPISGRPQ